MYVYILPWRRVYDFHQNIFNDRYALVDNNNRLVLQKTHLIYIYIIDR